MALGDHLFWWDHLMQFNVEFTVEILKGHVDHKMKFKTEKTFLFSNDAITDVDIKGGWHKYFDNPGFII